MPYAVGQIYVCSGGCGGEVTVTADGEGSPPLCCDQEMALKP